MIPIPPFVTAKLVMYAGLAVAIFMFGMATHKVFSDRRIAKLDAMHAKQTAAWHAQVADAQAAARAREEELQETVDKSRETANVALARIAEQARTIVRLRGDRDQLHNDLAAYASGAGAADTVSSCQSRAARLSGLVEQGDGLLEEGRNLAAGSAEAAAWRGAKLRACVEAWPK
jgi:hypothetical protein